MSYQVLARKWRPASFPEVVGQGHVVTALSNALDNDRVHHAFLFTGTRGVGKTTLARIFAKALNCEKGVSSTPCGICSSCQAVTEGRYVDLIEVDAASRTKVDDTRDLLDNVQYAPTTGRYKVYLIDEVHMLSTHSFNALLKTLEEPPEHVKFLLATTDPQKLPMTILSRCIQFTLSALEHDEIVDQLQKILEAEGIDYEQAALLILARAANGSMRDALSLLDQAIAHGNAHVTSDVLGEMLGLVDSRYIVRIFDALDSQDGAGLMAVVEEMTKRSTQLKAALDEVISALHTASVYQQAPKAIGWKGQDEEDVTKIATAFDAETLQLFYQIALLGKRDFDLAPDPRSAFEMVLMRLLAFKPSGASTTSIHHGKAPSLQAATAKPSQAHQSATKAEETASIYQAAGAQANNTSPPTKEENVAQTASSNSQAKIEASALIDNPMHWKRLIDQAGLSGMGRQLAMHMVPQQLDGSCLKITVDQQYKRLSSASRQAAIEETMLPMLSGVEKFDVSIGEVDHKSTAANYQVEQDVAAREQLQQSFAEDPNVKELVDMFDGEVDLASIKQTH